MTAGIDTSLLGIDDMTLVAERCRRSYRVFFRYMWENMFGTSKPYIHNWHIDCVNDHLEAIANGETGHTLFVLPPRHTKSTMVSHAFQPWRWLSDPGIETISAAFKQDRANQDARVALNILRSPWYQDLVDALPNPWTLDSKSVARITNTKMGRRLAIGMSGVQGENAKYVIVDDPLASTDAYSDTKLIRLNQWWNDDISNRFNLGQKGVFIVMQQRIAELDVVGLIFKNEKLLDQWNRVVLPTEYDPSHPTPFFSKVINRDTGKEWEDKRTKKGELLFPAAFPQYMVDDIKEKMSPRQFEAQHNGRPYTEAGGYFKSKWFIRLKKELYEQMNVEFVIQSWDTAFTERKLVEVDKGKEPSDSCCTTWYVTHFPANPREKYLVLADIWADQVAYPTLRDKIMEMHDKWVEGGPGVVIIENMASGQSLVQDITNMGITVHPFDPRLFGGKRLRAANASVYAKQGIILIPESDWRPDMDYYPTAMTRFPNGSQDLCDSSVQAWLWSQDNGVLLEGSENIDTGEGPMAFMKSTENPKIHANMMSRMV